MMKKSLWVDLFEAKGGKTNLFLYSINIQRVEERRTRKRPYYAEYRVMPWKNLAVWDRSQKEYLLEAAIELTPNFRLLVRCGFLTVMKVYPTKKTPSIGFFDVTPKRNSWYDTLTAKRTYYTRNLCSSSLNEIYKICTEIGVQLLYKHKRLYGPLDDKGFVDHVSKIKKSTQYHHLRSRGLTPQKLIEVSDAVISLPFTSTGIVAQAMENPLVILT